VDALRSRGPTGPVPRLSDAQLATVERALLEGAAANGFTGELWTLERIALVIEWRTGVRHHPAHVWALLRHRLGWSVQHPVRRAAERDQAAIDRWVAEDWPRIKQSAQRRRACLVFFDESALSLTPNVRRTWAPRGQPPTLTHPFNWQRASMAAAICYGVRGGGAQLCFHVQAGNYDTERLIEVLGELRKFLGGPPPGRWTPGYAAVVDGSGLTVACWCSHSMGGRLPRVECRRDRLYQAIQPKMEALASARVR